MVSHKFVFVTLLTFLTEVSNKSFSSAKQWGNSPDSRRANFVSRREILEHSFVKSELRRGMQSPKWTSFLDYDDEEYILRTLD